MKKRILSQIDMYHGDISMPKGFEIDRGKLSNDILQSSLQDCEFPFSKTWDMLVTYIREHIGVEYNINLINKKTWGDIYKPNQISLPLTNVDPLDLRNSPDYTLLYGVNVKNCMVRIHYDDNRRKDRSWDIPLTDNSFVMFPSSQMYVISNTQKESLNFVQTITFDYI